MSETKDTTVERATPEDSDQSATKAQPDSQGEQPTPAEASNQPATTAQPNSQGEQPPWNFSGNIEDKNPFSEFSEEHLNKLDAVLSSVEVRELLQQSTPELGILNMDLEGTAGNGSSGAPADSQDTDEPPAGSEHDDAESLPDSVITAVFSDHGYAINPERAPKSKPTAGTSVLPKPTQVLINMDTDHAAPIIGLNTDGTLIKGEEHPLLDVDITKPASPYSPSSPRKSGRAPTRNRYLDDDWVTASPYRGRGRGRGAVVADSGAFGLRASTRISDQKQRDLAEKIMMANRQAMEAEKQESSSSPESQGKGRGKKDPEEVPSPVGRGRGRVKKGKTVGKGGKSSQEESEDDENVDEEESEDKKSDGEVETVDSEPEPETVKKNKKKKKGGTYEHDSDFSESETKKGKTKKVKKKGKKGKAVEEESESETGKKKGKTKVKVDNEGVGKVGKGKKKGGDEQTDSEKSGKNKKSENTENDSEDTAKPKGKKGKKKLKLKNKKLKKKGKKEAESEEESESKDKEDKDTKSTKSPKVKSPKKLSKKERLKQLKEAKAAKKAKLLEKKKEKLKASKLMKKKGKKATETEPESSDVSPTKKKKKAVEKGGVESPTKKGKATEDAKTQSPGNKKTGKTVTKGVKKRSEDKPDLDTASPAKKARVEKQSKVKAKREMSDSEDDVPLKKIKTEMEAEATKLEADKAVTKKETIPKVTKGDQNIFSNLAGGMKQETNLVKSPPAKPGTKLESVKSDSTGTTSDTSTVTKVKTDASAVTKVKTDTKDSNKSPEVKNDKEAKTSSVTTVTSSGGKEANKDQDSKDKHHHHHHHHHHHRRHSSEHRDSVSSDRKDSTSDSKKDSHRRDSHDKSDSHSRRDSKDRKDSHHRRDSHEKSHDKDRRSSHSKDRKERRESSSSKDRRDSTRESDKKTEKSKERRDSAASSVSSTNGDKSGKNGTLAKKVVSKDTKPKPKKAKKEEIPIDSSMIDLFKPDNLPAPTKEEQEYKVKETMEETVIKASKVKFKDDTLDKQSSEVKSNDVDKVVSEVKTSEVETDSAMKEDNENISEEVKKSVQIESVKDELVDSKSVDVDISSESKETEVSDKVLSEAIPCADTTLGAGDNSEVGTDKKKEDAVVGETKVTNSVPEVEKDNSTEETKQTEAVKDAASENVSSVSTEQKELLPIVVVEKPPVKAQVKQKLKMSDFFTEKRLKINDPKPRFKVVKVVEPADDDEDADVSVEEVAPEASGSDGQRKRPSRNKAVAFAEILKKEKLGSDEEEEDNEFEDDENDEDFEDPDKLYCICRQPHNQRFMICCDRCEEWFHGKCVGITRARGQQMEENNEEYICPQCSENDTGSQGESSATETQDTSLKEVQSADSDSVKSADGKERASLFESMAGVETQTQESTVDDKVVSSSVKSPTISMSDKHQSHKTPPTSEQATPPAKQATPPAKQATPSSSKNEDKVEEKKKKSPLGQIRKKSDADLNEKRRRTIKMFKDGASPSKDKRSAKCMVCNTRPAKSGSVYCGSECQAKHSKEIVKPVSILKVRLAKDTKHDKEKHVAVVEKSTGKTLTGDKAPTEKELKDWLAQHPTYEILKPHKRPESKSDKKYDGKSSKQPSKTDGSDSKSQKHSEGPEPVRLNVRKGLRDALAARVDAADDIMLSNSEIKGLSLSIEEELFRYFKDTDHKYKAKYRSLIFNIKDHKNKGLFRKILNKRIRPSKLVRMSADELASKELAQWREQETKQTIEMIKQTETELMKEPAHVTKKTHKGEVEVEGEGGSDLSSLVTHEPKKDPPKPEPKTDLLADLLPDTTDRHGQHLFDANCKICTGKLVPAADTTPTKTTTTVVKTETKEKEKPEESMTKQERELQAEEVVKEVLKVIQRAKADAKKEELESQLLSSVTVRSPDSALSSGLDKKVKFTPNGPMLWKGFIYMQDVSKFVTTAYRVTGPAENLSLPDTITVCGRISPEHVWDYLNKVKQAASRDISVVRFIPGPSEEKAAYINLYSYLNSRSRCGVVEHSVKHIKDFYIVPLASHSKIPDVLMPFDGPGLEENRCHMLLGVIIRNKVHKSSRLDLPKSSRSSSSLKSALKDPSKTANKKELPAPETMNDSEKTSLASTPDKSSSSTSTPTTSSSGTPQEKKKSISFDPIVKEYSHVPDQEEPYEPGGDDPLGLNAPYDPEKETLKPKKAAKSDAVSLMIEKIAMSKNPAEATAAMVTALATSSRIGNQKKLLAELTKKVDEQKRLLEKKKMSSKPGDSPRQGSSSNTASPGLQGSPKDSSRKRNKGVSSKDPRIQAAMAAKQANAEAAQSPAPTTEPMDVDMRIPQPVVNTAPSSQGPAPSDPRLRQTANTDPVPSPAAVSSSSSVTSTTSVSHGISNSQKHSVDSSVSGHKPKGFYIDHDTAHSVSSPHQTKTGSSSKAAASKTNTVKDKQGTETESVKDKTETSKKSSGWTTVSAVPESNKPFSVIEMLKKEKAVSTVVTDTKPAVKANVDTVTDSKTQSSRLADQKSGKDGVTVGVSNSDPGIDIVSQLQAEVSGKSVSKDKPVVNSASASAIVGQIQAEVKGQSEITQDTQKKSVPNVTSLLKDLASGNAPAGSGQAGVQLPSALMSLFSKLPASEQGQEPAKTDLVPEPAKTELVPEPTKTELVPEPTAAEPEPEPQDIDMRNPVQSGGLVPGVKVFEQSKPNEKKKVTEMLEKEKLSKSFMGFDYDSDSSDGSFEGFDDDGTKKLSPRKRKLVEKAQAISSQKLFSLEDTDARQDAEDVDLRNLPGNVAMGNEDLKDVDERLIQPPTLAPGTDMAIPTSMMMDVDHRRPPFPPPPGLGIPFLGPNQPPPPGEEWNPNMPAPPQFPMSNLQPPPAISQPTPPAVTQSPPEVTQPPLPAEPPAPKPPEPPIKKSKLPDHKKKEDKTDKKVEKNKFGPLTSDERLKEIVLKIAGKDSIDTPPRGPRGPMGPRGSPRYSGPLLPLPPQVMPPGPPPMVTQGGMPVLPPAIPPPNSQNPPWSDHSGIGTSGWQDGPPPPHLLNSRSSMVPPVLPPQLQPGVAPPPPHSSMGPPPPHSRVGPPPPHVNAGPSPHHVSTGPPPHSDSGPSQPPQSFLDLPPVLPPAKQESPVHDDFDPYPPRLQPEFSGRSHGHSQHGRRSHEHDSDRRRHDRYGDRDRDSDRHRSRDHHRDRDRDGRDRSRGDRDSRDRRYRR